MAQLATHAGARSRSESFQNVGRTLEVMARAASAQKDTPRIRHLTDRVTRGVDSQNAGAMAQKIWRFLRREIRYVSDPVAVELVQTPDAVLESGHADCDGLATLAAAMLESMGIPAGFRAVAWEDPQRFDHVYAIYEPEPGADTSRWHALDPVGEPVRPGPDRIREQAVNTKTKLVSSESSDQSAMSATITTLATNGRPSAGLGQSNLRSQLPLFRGAQGEAVRQAQQWLLQLGYDLGGHGADGILGPDTQGAIERFQQINLLPLTGALDRTTWDQLKQNTSSGNGGGPTDPEVPDDVTTFEELLQFAVRQGPAYIRALRQSDTAPNVQNLPSDWRQRLPQQSGFLSGTMGQLLLGGAVAGGILWVANR